MVSTGSALHTSQSTETFAFDERARLLRHERQIDDQRFATGYQYDDDNRVSLKHLPDGQTLRYHYIEEPGPTRGNLQAITRETLFGAWVSRRW